MLFVAPFDFLRGNERVRDGAEGRLSRLDHGGLALGFNRVFPGFEQLAGFVRLVPRFGERNHVRRSEPGFRDFAGIGEAVDPFPRAARRDNEIKPAAVAIAPRLCGRRHSRREFLFSARHGRHPVLQLVLQFDAGCSGQLRTREDTSDQKSL